jgi:hypothetical protein
MEVHNEEWKVHYVGCEIVGKCPTPEVRKLTKYGEGDFANCGNKRYIL